MRRRAAAAVVLLLVALLGTYLWLYPPLFLIDAGDYNRTTVEAVDSNGTTLATVEVRVAETREQRRIGLMRTDSLDENEGMLFVHPRADDQQYIMDNMDFPIDIIFIDSDGTVTEIRNASVPGEGEDGPYTGYGKYVLEVNRGWAAANGLDVGDTVRLPDEYQ
ncbi:MAG: DUF192 domain-containing protein [Halovenus sp.]